MASYYLYFPFFTFLLPCFSPVLVSLSCWFTLTCLHTDINVPQDFSHLFLQLSVLPKDIVYSQVQPVCALLSAGHTHPPAFSRVTSNLPGP